MQFIRKHAAPLTVLTTLLAAFAAPYLIPENPDSAVFRSGALSCALLLGAAYPVWDALRRAKAAARGGFDGRVLLEEVSP